MSDVKIGYGAQFHMAATGGSSDLTKLAEVTSVALPNEQTAEVEVTHYESPNRTKEFISGLIDPGELSIEINYIAGSDTDDLIVAAKGDGAVRQMKIVLPQYTQQFTFPGIVRGYDRSAPIEGRMTATITIRVAGAVIQAAVVA